MKLGRLPISKVRAMQINGTTTPSSVPVVNTTTSYSASAPNTEAVDTADLSNSASSFASYVNEASQMPEVRSEVVDSYRARVHAGQYPSAEVVAGLTRLIGGPIMQMVNSGKSFGDSSSES